MDKRLENRFTSSAWGMSHKSSVETYNLTDKMVNHFWGELLWLLQFIRRRLHKKNHVYSKDDHNLNAANWILAFNALELLDHSLFLMKYARYSGSAQLFRDIIAINDLIRLINLEKDKKYLKKWFNGEFTHHSDYRKFIESENNAELSKHRKSFYVSLSKLPHITYDSVLTQFIVGKNDNKLYHGSLVRTSYHEYRNITTPREFIWFLVSLTKDYVFCLDDCDIIDDKNFNAICKELKKVAPEAFIL